jgi:3'-phosphoadenosine 5'-phosphosulfate sulfotransferase (PAPS reductase)/FAD synthetase
MVKQKLLVSFSGGRTSAFMTKWLLENMQHKYDMIVVFANSGREREETLQFVNKCDVEFGFNVVWVEAFVHNKAGKGTTHIVTNFKDAERNGKPFEDVIYKYGLPSPSAPHCSRELKKAPINSYAKSIGWKNYETALGIRSDEPKRLNWEVKKKNKFLYFAELFHVTKSDVNIFWSKQSFDLELKSFEGNCDLCYKKGFRKLMTILKDKPELADWWREMEIKYAQHTSFNREKNNDKPYRFYRDNMTIDDIIEESKLPFDLAIDESKDIDRYKQLFLWDSHLDSNNGCSESCEVF